MGRRSKKIAFILTDLWQGGGGEAVACTLANYFTEEGYCVTLFSLTKNESKKNILMLSPKVEIVTASHIHSANKLFNKIRQYREAMRYLSTADFDYTLGIGSYPSLLLALLPFHRGKIIACMHGSYAGLPRKWKFLLFLFMRRCDLCVCLTSHDEKYYRRICPTKVIANSVAIQDKLFSPRYEAKQLLAVGRFDFLKGYDFMIDIISSFHLRCPEWKLVIRGDGPTRHEISRQISAAHLQETVTILPPSQNLRDDYLAASIFIHTSRSEGLPMVLLEAASYGLPLVAFDCLTGPREIITDGENGFLIPCFDKGKFVAALEILAESEETRRRLGHNARIKSGQFSPDKIKKEWFTLFEKVL